MVEYMIITLVMENNKKGLKSEVSSGDKSGKGLEASQKSFSGRNCNGRSFLPKSIISSNSTYGYRLFALEMILTAIRDAYRGNSSALAWLKGEIKGRLPVSTCLSLLGLNLEALSEDQIKAVYKRINRIIQSSRKERFKRDWFNHYQGERTKRF